jgi:hypothetical protein
MRGRGCIAAALLARLLALAATALLAGCDLLPDATNDPWQGYAWQKEEGRFEWVLVSSATYRECLDAIQSHLQNTEDGRLRYSAPWGCGYHGPSYLRAWILNFVYPANGSNFQCIARYRTQGVEQDYGPLFKGASQSPSSIFYCA